MRSLPFAAILILLLTVSDLRADQTPIPVAPGVYALLGDNGEIGPKNAGVIGNAGFIVGSTGVVAIDTGVSAQYGEQMLDAISGVADLPVVLAVITHPVQEFLFGAAAFQAHGIPVLAHRETAILMQKRCGSCLVNLRKLLGSEAMHGSRVVTPDRIVDAPEIIHVAGIDLELLHFGWAATQGDLAVFDRRTGVLFAGGLVAAGRVPLLRDGKLEGWIAALEQLRKLPLRIVVPGHGMPGPPAEIDATLDYLHQLDRAVRAEYSNGASLLEALNRIRLPRFESLAQYAIIHPQNVQLRYRQLEDEDLLHTPGAATAKPGENSAVSKAAPRASTK